MPESPPQAVDRECDVCGDALDSGHRVYADTGYRVCSKCEATAAAMGGGSCVQDPDFICNGTCDECEVNL